MENISENKILNIGCGRTRIPNSIGLDRAALPGYVDVVHDLDQRPFPFAAESFSEIFMYHVLEHLADPVATIEEVYRLLRPGGRVYIRVPHFSSMGAFTDITHKRPFGYRSFDCFGIESDYYTKAKFEIVTKKLRYFGNYPQIGPYGGYLFHKCTPVTVKFLAWPLNWLMNLSPILFERVWCYWIGGALEVFIVLKKKKND